jgi:hypothetical protein
VGRLSEYLNSAKGQQNVVVGAEKVAFVAQAARCSPAETQPNGSHAASRIIAVILHIFSPPSGLSPVQI